MSVYEPKTIQEAIKDLKIFFLADLYTKFNSEIQVGNEKWLRDDVFKTFDEFQEYIEGHFKVLEEQVKELEVNQSK